MLKLSKAALVAAAISLTAVPAVGISNAYAQDSTSSSNAGFTTTLSVPTITAVDSTMDEDALRDLFTGGFMKHVDELAKLNATSITIPSVTLTMTVASKPSPNVVVYKDIVLNNVKDGVAADASVGAVSTTSDGGTFAFGKLAASNLDFSALLGLYGLVNDGSGDQSMKPMYTDMSFDGGTFAGPNASCTLGKISTSEFDARPLKVSFSDMLAATNRMDANKDNPDPKDIVTLVNFFTDIFSAFKSAPLNMDGLSCKGTGDDGKPFDLGIGSLTMDGYQPGIYPALTVKDVKISDGSANSVTLGQFVFKQTDLSGPIATIQAQTDLTPEWFEKNYRQLIPAFAGLSMSNLKVDVPDPDTDGARITGSVDDLDVSLSNYVNGIPSTISTSAHGIQAPLPANSDDQSIQMLKALGINSVNLDYALALGWDKDSQSIKIDKISVSGKDLGSSAVAAVLGNATSDLFDVDTNKELAAAMGLTVKSLQFDLADAGIGDKLVPMLAQQQGMDAATYRQKMAGIAEGAALQMLGATDEAKQLGDALGAFIGGTAKALTVTITAKDPNGIGVPELTAAENNPVALTQAVDITGSAK